MIRCCLLSTRRKADNIFITALKLAENVTFSFTEHIVSASNLLELFSKPVSFDSFAHVSSSSRDYVMRKLSSTSQLIEKMGKVCKSLICISFYIWWCQGRKVSRQGQFLVFTEKYGLLTTQNGTQQVDFNSFFKCV